ncbi:LysE family translocator [Pseudomonas putida]
MDDLLLYLAALAMIYLMPGPDMILLLQTGARQGRRRALATALGLAMARACHVTLAAVGLASLFKVLPWTFEVVKFAGAGYLLWLGIRMFKAVSHGALPDQPANSPPGQGLAAMRRGLLTNILNPKALLFCSVLLPQFIQPALGPVLGQFALLGAILVTVGAMFDVTYVIAGGWLGRRLEQSAIAQKVQGRLFGTVLIGFALRLAWAQ